MEKGSTKMEYLGNQPQAVLGQILVDQVKREAERTAEQTVSVAAEDEFDTRSAKIQDYVGNQLAERNDIGAEAQKELAAAIRLIGDIATTDKPWIRKNLELLGSIDTAVKAVLRESPQLEYAKRTRKHVHRRVHPVFGTGLLESLKRSVKASPLAVVIIGLFITLWSLLGSLSHSSC
jgi:hypothetical protein